MEGHACLSPPPSPEIVLEKNKTSRKPKPARGPRTRPVPTSLSQHYPAAGTGRGFVCGVSEHLSPSPYGLPSPVLSHLCRGRCGPAGTVPLTPGTDFAPKLRPGGQRARGCRPSKAPQLLGPLPGWVFPSRGGRREAGRGRGRFGKATSPGFPTAPARQCPRRTPAGGGSARPGEVGSGLLISVPEAGLVLPGVCGNPCRETPSHHSPKPAVSSRPEAEAAPQKQMGCVFPYLSAGPGEPRRAGGSVSGSFSPAVSRSRNFLRPGPGTVRGSRAVPGGPRGRGEPHTPGRVYICRKKGNLSAYTKNRGC